MALPTSSPSCRLLPVLLLALLAGCASRLPPPPELAATELTAVPFFPQQQYQCGPAALATVLAWSGVDTSADELTPQVYLPDREGSLQLELIAASRRAQRLPFLLEGGAPALFAELGAGHPVLVLQNFGLRSLPQWHYAVVVGYDPEQREVLLRSGTEQRRRESWRRFMTSWAQADYWGLVVLPPGKLPAAMTADAVATSVAGNETRMAPAVTLAAWEAALRHWPEQPAVLFGAANARYTAGQTRPAASLYRRLLQQQPGHLAARNNFADLLLNSDCPQQAEQVLGPALERLGTGASPTATTAAVRTTAAEIDAHPRRAGSEAEVCGSLLP
ncbi:PA2778 family cysteine peptidase [Kineobactrum salinum]|uniref:PA2778 family cysteine peptidase n=1 Tax=Kineobactrum salinum TaxID=2708301 RepID=A0A6C0TZM4_9GAMM|nr:PA2778 family cysteine peptidase [Kineobactrum salinum]QIB65216.1 PA2778 family cysteine peptidase [Kineobactrum salinum]